MIHDFADALALAESHDEIFIIGGGEIYRLFMDFAEKLYITEVDTAINNGDTTFPPYENHFTRTSLSPKTDATCPLDYHFTEWVRG